MRPTSSSALIVATVDAAYAYLQTPWAQQWKHTMPPNVYRHEMKTVSITLPRGIGHSTAALQLLQKYPTAHMMYPSYMIMKHTLDTAERHGFDRENLRFRSHTFSMTDRIANEKLIYDLREPKSIVIFDPLPFQALHRRFEVERAEYQSKRPEPVLIPNAFNVLVECLDQSTEMFVYLQGASL